MAMALLALLATSSVLLYSSGNGNLFPRAFKQIVFSGIAIVAFLFVISVNIKNIERFSYAILAASFLSLIAVIPLGKHVMGASRWIDLGFFMVQPSEFAKLAVVLALANFFRSVQAKSKQNPHHRMRICSNLTTLVIDCSTAGLGHFNSGARDICCHDFHDWCSLQIFCCGGRRRPRAGTNSMVEAVEGLPKTACDYFFVP